MENLNTKLKLRVSKYRKLSERALKIAKKNIAKGKENEKNADEIIKMVECYLSDSIHFEKKGDLINSLSCLNYAHGWLDSGARLGIFDVNNSDLFTVA